MTLFERFHIIGLGVIQIVNAFIPEKFLHKDNSILCYHSVANSKWRFTIPTKLFEEHIQWLCKHYSIVPLHDIVAGRCLSGSVAITFDDAYEDVFLNAYPILKRYGVTATIFPLGMPAKARRTELDNSLSLMSSAQLKKLAHEGWEIGYHTATHADLTTLSQEECEMELQGSKKLGNELKLAIRYFAYPKGHYNSVIAKQVENEGFIAAFTVDGGKINYTDMYRITRVPTEGLTSVGELAAMLSPLGLLFESFCMTLLQKKEALVRFMRK